MAHRSHSDKVSLDFVIATAVEWNESEAQPVSEDQSEPESERQGHERAAENSPSLNHSESAMTAFLPQTAPLWAN